MGGSIVPPGPPGSGIGRGQDPDGPAPPPLRVAFFTDTFVPAHDGVSQVTDTLARALLRQGNAVTIFTVRSPGLPRSETRPDGLAVRRYRSISAPSYPQYRIALTPWTVLLRRRRDFDLVHIHTPGFVGLAGWLAARRWRCPTIGTYHTNLTDLLRATGSNALSRAFFRAWSRFSIDICRRSDLATAPSEAARSALLPRTGTRPSAVPRLVVNGVDTERFRPGIHAPDWRRRIGRPNDRLITFLGRLTQDKGANRVLDALEQVDSGLSWVGVLGGEGPEGPALAARLRKSPRLTGRVRFVGVVPEEDKPALLSQSSIFVLPSRSDTSSVALLEAMASGATAVVSSRGGPGEIARRSEVGLIVDPDDTQGLARAIERLLTDRALAARFSDLGRSWVVEQASTERMAAQMLDCYRTVLGRTGRA